jgi:PadR family transcriptional regulator PadR
MTPAPDTQSWPAEWMRGVLELCVLGVVAQGPTYGYAIAQSLAEAGLGTVKGGTLYPLLTRLETDGLVVATWRAGDGGPGRKFFELTPAGAAELDRRSPLWAGFTSLVASLPPSSPVPQPGRAHQEIR